MSELARRAVVVEDEPLVSALLGDTLRHAGFDVETAHDAASGRQAVEEFDPDVALIDLGLGRGPNGADLAHVISREFPQVALLILTKYPDERTAGVGASGLPSGCGFLRKADINDAAALVGAVELVLTDQTGQVRSDHHPARPLASLTKTQIEVLRMLSQGYTNQEIARRRGVSTGSVEQVINSIYRSLGITRDGMLSPRTEAMRIFITHAGMPERD